MAGVLPQNIARAASGGGWIRFEQQRRAHELQIGRGTYCQIGNSQVAGRRRPVFNQLSGARQCGGRSPDLRYAYNCLKLGTRGLVLNEDDTVNTAVPAQLDDAT